mmetsp:Transcript_1535/g.4651  ORF Transcript_1535/g.4651 Transcript_1535/m.4651 type:complete len:214 (+) Transcript_1535:595-1236(+)
MSCGQVSRQGRGQGTFYPCRRRQQEEVWACPGDAVGRRTRCGWGRMKWQLRLVEAGHDSLAWTWGEVAGSPGLGLEYSWSASSPSVSSSSRACQRRCPGQQRASQRPGLLPRPPMSCLDASWQRGTESNRQDGTEGPSGYPLHHFGTPGPAEAMKSEVGAGAGSTAAVWWALRHPAACEALPSLSPVPVSGAPRWAPEATEGPPCQQPKPPQD